MRKPINFKASLCSLTIASLLTGCVSIQPVGDIGPQKLHVFNISHNDFLSSSQMLVILDKKGNVAAYTGGTVAGLGSVGLQTGASLASAGAIYYGAKAIQHGLQNSSVKINAPNNFSLNVKGHVNVDTNG